MSYSPNRVAHEWSAGRTDGLADVDALTPEGRREVVHVALTLDADPGGRG